MTEFSFDRIPKYKAWDREKKKYFHVYGLTMPQAPAFLGAVFDGDNDIPWKGRIEILQYTGRHDIEGREACEADIAEVNVGDPEPLIGVVVHSKSGFVFKLPGIKNPLKDGEKMHITMSQYPFRIIGTVQQNPELISPSANQE